AIRAQRPAQRPVRARRDAVPPDDRRAPVRRALRRARAASPAVPRPRSTAGAARRLPAVAAGSDPALPRGPPGAPPPERGAARAGPAEPGAGRADETRRAGRRPRHLADRAPLDAR